MTLPRSDTPRPLPCAQCGASLAFDQRYCVECGNRRWGLPAPVAGLIGRMHERSGRPILSAPCSRAGRPIFSTPHPQSAAIAVMAMLGFGVILGDVSGSGTLTLAAQASRRPIAVTLDGSFGMHHALTSAAPYDSGGGGGGGSAPAAPSTAAGSTSAVSTPASVPATTGTGVGTGTAGMPGPLVLPPVKHVFLIVLSDQGYTQSFAGDRYLSRKLVKQGELVPNYYGVAGSSLADEIAMISGQGPTAQTEAGCPIYAPVTTTSRASDGQLVGSGCVYPKTVRTVADQLSGKHRLWRAYVDGQPHGRAAREVPCGAPALGAADPHAIATAGSPYVTAHNPFLYFQALMRRCGRTTVPFTGLKRDLKRERTTPALSYIVPSPCENGDDTPCSTGAKSGLPAADGFLRRTLALIERSPAYRNSGLIAITFDHAPQAGPHADSSACCSTPAYPNLPAPSTTPTGTSTTPIGTTTTPTGTSTTPIGTTTTTAAPVTTTTTPSAPTSTTPTSLGNGETTPTGGGGQVGLLLLSRYVKPGASDTVDYFNHYSLLAGIESLFKLKLLGFAGDLSLPRFQPTLFDYHQPSG